MAWWLVASACVRGPEDRYLDFGGTYGSSSSGAEWEFVDPAAWAPWTCAADRDEDWAAWPGGQQMYVTATSAIVGEPITLTVRGATAGDLVEFRRGGICRLDCPVELDGGCFHPTRGNLLGQAVADDDGVATLTVSVAIGWSGAWWAVQARVLDAERPYVSQPLLAHTEDWTGEFPIQLPLREVSATSIRGLAGPFRALWAIPAGREASIGSTAPADRYTSSFVGASESATVALAADEPFSFLAPSTVAIDVAPSGTEPPAYDLDLSFGDAAAPILWYLDGDDDGWGDASATPVASVAPIDGTSPSPSDCDDGDPARAPYAAETCGDGIDQDCDGKDRDCVDADGGEGFVDALGTQVSGPARLDEPPQLWIEAGDLDGDGLSDLVLGPIGVASAIHRQDVDLDGGDLLPAGMWMGDVGAVGDLDGDGADDLISARSGSVQLLLGPLATDGAWDAAIGLASASGSVPEWVASGDFDGDGSSELVLPSARGADWFPHPLHDAEPALSFPLAEARPRAADLDADGIDDLMTGDGCVRVGPLLAGPDDCLASSESAGAPALFAWFDAGDVDGDGRSDLVAALGGGLVYVIASAPPWVEVSAENAAYLALESATPPSAVAVVEREGPGTLAGLTAQYSWALDPAGGGTISVDETARWLFTGSEAVRGVDLDEDGADELVIATFGAPWADRAALVRAWVVWGD